MIKTIKQRRNDSIRAEYLRVKNQNEEMSKTAIVDYLCTKFYLSKPTIFEILRGM